MTTAIISLLNNRNFHSDVFNGSYFFLHTHHPAGVDVFEQQAPNNHSVHVHVPMKKYAQAEGVSAGFGVDLESVTDLSCGIGVSETAECSEKVQRTSVRPHVDLVPGGNGTGMRLTRADT